MSLTQPNRETSRPRRLNRLLFQGGVGLLAASCVVLLLVAAVAKVQDAADRTH